MLRVVWLHQLRRKKKSTTEVFELCPQNHNSGLKFVSHGYVSSIHCGEVCFSRSMRDSRRLWRIRSWVRIHQHAHTTTKTTTTKTSKSNIQQKKCGYMYSSWYVMMCFFPRISYLLSFLIEQSRVVVLQAQLQPFHLHYAHTTAAHWRRGGTQGIGRRATG